MIKRRREKQESRLTVEGDRDAVSEERERVKLKNVKLVQDTTEKTIEGSPIYGETVVVGGTLGNSWGVETREEETRVGVACYGSGPLWA